jgi:hypothetical protein
MEGNAAQSASDEDTTGTSVSGTGAALPGGSATDSIPWAASGQLGGETGPGPLNDSSYAVTEADPERYGWAPGSPDTEGVYGGSKPNGTPTQANPNAFNGVSTAYGAQGEIDTVSSLGSNLVPAEYPSPNLYRKPSSVIAASVKDTTLTDVLGSQIASAPLTDASYAATDVDTLYIGAPAAPAPLSAQADAFTDTAAATRYYLTRQGVMPATIVVKDTTHAGTLVSGTDYAVTTAGNGPDTSSYLVLTAGTNYTAGDSITIAYSYGTPQYFDSNLPVPAAQSQADTLHLSQRPVQLLAWNVTTSAADLAVYDVTQAAALTYDTDYAVAQVTAPHTPGQDYAETPPVSYRISWKPTSAVAKLGDTIMVTYDYDTSVPPAPSVGSAASQTDSVASFTSTASALSKTGIVTPPAALDVLDVTNGKTLVLNTDYTVAITGTGSTLTYSVSRLSGSTNSTSGDHVTVTYSYGDAAYFTSGPVTPQNEGVWVPFAPPSGTTPVDYYFVQSSDLGTQYVPKTGLPVNYGQPSPSGGSAWGQPAYQVDAFSVLAPPAAPVLTTAATGGTVAAGVYKAEVTYVSATGESAGSAQGTVTAAGTTSTVTVPSPPAVVGATGWYAYVSQAGGSTLTRQQAAGTPTAIGTALTISAPPTSSGAGAPAAASRTIALSRSGVVTPPGQLVVRDLTSIQEDPLQPDASVLIYDYDYTVTGTGTGPWQTYSIQLLSTSVNAKPTDTITVSYWWNPAASGLSSAEDTLTLAAGTASLAHQDIATAPQDVIVWDTTVSRALAYGADFTVSLDGEGTGQSASLSVITTGPAGAGAADTLHAYYSYGSVLGTLFTQGLRTNDVPVAEPSGAAEPAGFRFAVAAGNRAGLGPFSGWSDLAAPLNYNAPQPGSQGSTGTITFRDPANTVNPIYLPSGETKSGTGLG